MCDSCRRHSWARWGRVSSLAFCANPRCTGPPVHCLTSWVHRTRATALATGGVLNVNTNSAGSGGTVSATAGGMFGTPVVTYTQTGLVTNQITDLPNPAGNYGTSIAVTQQHSQTVTNNPAGFGPPGGFLNYTSTATDVRNYTVADDGTGPVVPTVNLIETYSFAILGPATGNVAVTGGMAFAGVGFGAAAVYPAAPTYAVNTGSTLLSASWTNLGNHHTLNLMVSTPVTVGSVVSIANFTTLTTSLTNGSNISDMVSVAINYGAHF